MTASPPRPAPVIDAFGGGGFRIDGVRIKGSVLILDGEVRPWPVLRLADLRPADLAEAAARGSLGIEVLLLGVGATMAPAPRAVRDTLAASGVGLDVLTTPEACRLHNYLAGEGRRVAAALIAV